MVSKSKTLRTKDTIKCKNKTCFFTLKRRFVLKTHSQVFGNWKLFKNDENCFLFPFKAFFVLKILQYLSWFFVHVEKRLIRKLKASFKFYDVTTWIINNSNTILSNISRSKCNRPMKFGKLIECNNKKHFSW